MPVVLVVDDERDIRDSLEQLIESAIPDVAVRTAESGAAALAILRAEPVDLILTDYKMPGMTGIEFLAEARALAPGVPRILMTAFPDLDLAMRSINEEKVENFLTKPLNPTRVVEILNSVIEEKRAEEQRQRAFARGLDALRRQREGA